MKRFGAVLLAWSMTRLAFGHGFELTLDGNHIAAESEVPTISSHLFIETLTAASPTQLFTDHGGVEAGAGFNIPPDALSVEFLGPLWYSNAGKAQHATAGLNLNATSFDSQQAVLGSVDITGTTMNPGSFPVVGDDDHSIGWILSGATIPAGAYGFAYRVTGFKDGDETKPFVSSVPLVVVFDTPDFANNLEATQQAIFDAVLRGDFDRNLKTNIADIKPMLKALTDLTVFQTNNELDDAELKAIADVDGSGSITNADVQALLDSLSGGPIMVPEPSAFVLAAIGFVIPLANRRGNKRPLSESIN
jgi:hypothetical protein